MPSNTRSSRHPAPRAFTLIELLVVISITALLVAMLLPVISRAKEASRRVLCATNFRQIGIVIQAYANDNKPGGPNGGGLFRHQRSMVLPLAAYWLNDDPTYIPLEQREAHPQAMAYLANDSHSEFDQLGGPIGSGAFFPALYPNYVPAGSGKMFECPSVHNYAWSNVASVFYDYTHFESSMGPYLRGQAVYGEYWSTYVGNIYGRPGRPNNEYGQSHYSSYFIQGYYPYYTEYQSSPGALMWDCGTYAAWLAPWVAPNLNLGCHVIGGNELFVDGAVKWRSYPWMPQNQL